MCKFVQKHLLHWLIILFLFFGLCLFKQAIAAQVQIINNPQEAFEKREAAFKEAKNEIFIALFILTDDSAGMYFADLFRILKLQNPNLSIKILVDAHSSKGAKFSNSYAKLLTLSGVEMRVFNEMNLKNMPRNFINRLHDKIIIIDKEKFFLGGRNIEDHYYGLSKTNFRDRDVYVESKTVAQDIHQYLSTLWNIPRYTTTLKASKITKKELQDPENSEFFANLKLPIPMVESPLLDYPKLFESAPIYTVSDEKIKFFANKNGDVLKKQRSYLSNQILDALDGAQKRIILETPYAFFTRSFRNKLYELRKKGIEVTLITSSLCTTDSTRYTSYFDLLKNRFLKRGIRIFEYAGLDNIHTKSLLIDDEKAILGSDNFNFNSRKTNSESLIEIADKQIAAQLESDMNSDISLSQELILNENNEIIGNNRNCEVEKKKKETII